VAQEWVARRWGSVLSSLALMLACQDWVVAVLEGG